MDLKDFTQECMLEWQGSVEEMRNSFCRACAQKECKHSFAASTATAKKVRKHEELKQFRSPVSDGASLPVIAESVTSAPVVTVDEIPVLEDLQTEQRGDALVQLVPPPQDVAPAELEDIGEKLAAVRAAHAETTPLVREMEPPPVSAPEPQRAEAPQLPPIPRIPPPPSTEPVASGDPWALPLSHERSLDYTEKEPEDDPWSTGYKGARTIKAHPGQKIVLSGVNDADAD